MTAQCQQDSMSLGVSFDNSYARELEGFFQPSTPAPAAAPSLLYWNLALAQSLGLAFGPAHSRVPSQGRVALSSEALAQIFSGNRLPQGAEPIAQAYAGHQFGHFNPQLGDGRALLIGEVCNPQGQRYDIAFKGSGRTPYSRGGDGKAALGPMLREVLISEAMHALGVPTTRALAVVASGETVYREGLLPGAILTRVAASHIRIGTFEYFAARGESERVKQLADYTIARHDPTLVGTEQPYLGLLRAVAQRQAKLIAQWIGLGFIHGVMNTDNVSIAGETIDYGPCAFIDAYNPKAVFSSIDEHGRYAYQNQPRIAQWNLARFAEALLPLLASDQDRAITLANEVISAFPAWYSAAWLGTMRQKMGLSAQPHNRDTVDTALIEAWLDLLQQQQVDFTLAWRYLSDARAGNADRLLRLFSRPDEIQAWLRQWQQRVEQEALSAAQGAQMMQRVNPLIIPRNHHVEAALAAASSAELPDFAPFERLLAALQQPYSDNSEYAEYAEPAAAAFTQCYRTFCGT